MTGRAEVVDDGGLDETSSFAALSRRSIKWPISWLEGIGPAIVFSSCWAM